MAPSKRPANEQKRALAFFVWLYGLFLYAYPAPFRQAYGERLLRVFRDACRATLSQRGILFLLPLWGRTFADLLWSAGGERWQSFKENAESMASSSSSQALPVRLWIAFVATLLAFGVELVASLNLYLLEDANPLTGAAYSASPLLRFSYDAVYLSALASGIAVCAAVAYLLLRRDLFVTVGLVLLTILVALGGFGGLLVRHPATFFVLLIVFLILTVGTFLTGRAITARAGRFLATRPAAVLGACTSVGTVLLINLVALILHTLLLNPVSHALYMQGQIAGTHFNFSLLVMVLAFLTLTICLISLRRAFRLPAAQA